MATGDDFRESCNNDDAEKEGGGGGEEESTAPNNFRLKNEDSNEFRAVAISDLQLGKSVNTFSSCVVCSPL